MQRRLVQFDWAIKNLLRNKANFAILEGFLSELLHTSIIIDHILESERNKFYEKDKSNKVDILALTATGEKILIELQVDREWDYLHRMLYGTSKLIVEYMKEVEAYSNIKKVIAVEIVFFDLGHGEDYIYHGQTIFKGVHAKDQLMLNETEKKMLAEFRDIPKELSGELSPADVFPDYYLIKVNKFNNQIKDKFDEWIYFIKNNAIPNEFNAQGLHIAQTRLDILSLDEKDRINYDGYVKSLHDKASEVQTHNINLRLAHDEGKLEGEIKIIKQMIHSGMTVESIANIVGRTPAEIENMLR